MKTFFLNTRFILLIFFFVTVAASLWLYFSMDHHGGRDWHAYNNYLIFKNSFIHLDGGQNLYRENVPVYWDIYKYTPTFALFMGLFAWLPDALGLISWNLLNMLVLFFGIYHLPLDIKKRVFLYWFILLELLTSMQGMQSNALMTGLLLFAFHNFERRRLFAAALYISFAAFIKGYGAIGFIFFLFYPGKVRFMLYAGVCMLLLFLLPLILISPAQLIAHYHDWCTLLLTDQRASTGLSVIGLFRFSAPDSKAAVMLAGLLFFLLPVFRISQYQDAKFRYNFVATTLVWAVIFNHKAESQTYIMAVTGVGMWLFMQPASLMRNVLAAFVFLITSVSHTDLVPVEVKKEFIYPYCIKALPCFVLWLIMMYDLLGSKKTAVENSNLHPIQSSA